MTELVVVPSERHVEQLARAGVHAETRTRFYTRLATRLLPRATFVSAEDCRVVLAVALSAVQRGQLDLYGSAAAAAASDPLLAVAFARGGASWVRLCDAIDEAIGALRARRIGVDLLEKVSARAAGVARGRASALATAMRALDARLAPAHDERLLRSLLADALRSADRETIAELVGADVVKARYIFDWEPADAAVWRALDEALGPRGGARVVLPTYERALEGDRERDALEAIGESVAELLDAAPELETIEELEPARARLMRVADVGAQARVVARIVSDAIDAGVPVERIALVVPTADEQTLGPMRRAFAEVNVVVHESRGEPPSQAPVVVAAMLALSLQPDLERRSVARLLRTGYVDGDPRRLGRLSRALERTASLHGEDPVDALVRTAGEEGDEARRIGSILASDGDARTRTEHVRAARRLFDALGIGARAGRGGLATFSRDEAPAAVAGAERAAIARDARAFDALAGTLDRYEALAVGTEVIDGETFRLEILDALDATTGRPSAGRAGAIRVLRVAELAGEDLDLLVVVDATEGRFPRDDRDEGLLSPALSRAIVQAGRGTAVAAREGARRDRDLAAFALAASRARSVVLIAPSDDPNGAPLAPSPVVSDLERRGVALEVPVVLVQNAGVVAPLRVARERVREAFFLDPTRPRSDVVGTLEPTANLRELLQRETGGDARPIAVTSLERFARCPFMGYAHVVLRTREIESAEEVPDAREEGNLVHEVLAAAFEATRELWPVRPRAAETIAARALAAADDVLRRQSGRAPLRGLTALRVREAVSAVIRQALVDDDWDFAFAEQSFGGSDDRSWSPFTVAAPGERIALRGTIDRIDRAHDGRSLRVVDYKRSLGTVRDASSSLGEAALQVPLYARVAATALGAAAGGAYMPFQARDLATSSGPSARVFQRVVDLAAPEGDGLSPIERRSLAVVSRARRGDFTPLPIDETECRTCAVSGGCRKPRFAMAPLDELEEGS